MRATARHGFIIAFFAAAPALADPGLSEAMMRRAAAPDPVLEQALAANARQDWPRAEAILRDALEKNPGNADYHNLYAYALRKSGSPDIDLVFKHYNEALRLDQNHRGAHEYLGEAYLMVGNLAKAKEHLDALDRLCVFGCEEYTKLKQAVAEYQARSK